MRKSLKILAILLAPIFALLIIFALPSSGQGYEDGEGYGLTQGK